MTLGMALGIILGAWAGVSYAYQYVTVIRHTQKLKLILNPDIVCDASTNGVWLGYKNNSTATIESISFQFTATEVGHSTNVIDNGYVIYDGITAPGEDYAQCVYFTLRPGYVGKAMKLAPINGQVVTVIFR
jgi:hypothetical protein